MTIRLPIETVSLSFCLLFILAACGKSGQAPPTAPIPATSSSRPAATLTMQQMADDAVQRQFLDRLRGDGLAVTPGDSVGQPFLRVQGTIVRLHGGSLAQSTEIQSYAYKDSSIAAADVQRIAPDGGGAKWTNPDGTGQGVAIDWIAPPHFFRQDRLLVIYVGRDDTVVMILTKLLGPQFAGG